MSLPRTLALLTSLVIVKVALSVLWGYRDYLPPNFSADFLAGREVYFWGAYAWAFYAHLVSGPTSLLLGLVLVSERFRHRWPGVHRRLGRVQAANVLALVVPSGLWMARYASTVEAGAGLAMLGLATACCVVAGWRAAVTRRFVSHRRWMERTFLLLCSAVVIRLIGGLSRTVGFEPLWLDGLASWISWLVPWAIYEMPGWLPAASGVRRASGEHVSRSVDS